MRSIKWIVLFVALSACTTLMAQQQNKSQIDTPGGSVPPMLIQADTVRTKTDGKKADKKKKKEKVDKKAATQEPEPTAQSPHAESPSAVTDSTQIGGKKSKKSKVSKPTAKGDQKKIDPSKARKTEKPRDVPHATPGAEAEANAKVKDPIDRTRKGPSGQKVYLGPRSSIYYINSNGQKIFIKKEVGQ